MAEDKDYIHQQADSLFQQWQFYENLTWRIPTMAVTVNGGLLAALKLLGQGSSPITGAVLYCIIGALNLLYGYRLYRSSKLARRLLRELQEKFDGVFGVRGVVRSTRDMNWPFWARYSSRLLMAHAFNLWGLTLVMLGVIQTLWGHWIFLF